MHEMALAQGVVEIVEATATRHGARRVIEVRLEIGDLSHVEPRALAFCFDAASRGTPAEGARLAIRRSPGQATCLRCVETFALAARGDPCPRCGGYQLVVVAGEEMRVTDLEVE